MNKIVFIVVLAFGCAVGKPASTPLVDASRSGDAREIRALCAHGSDPDEPAGVNGWTPLLHAVHKNQAASVDALLDAGADVDRTGPSGTTPLMMAAGYGNDSMVALLLRHGADARARDGEGATAIDYAMTGVSDLDSFTLFRCQEDTVGLLAGVSPAPQASSLRWSRLKRCG